ncbi:PT domain-containing protein [Limosilactobacillus reuteri]|uniref:mucin-binding protein n=2 Tax=Limosilactobacillus reuteri TaxID=1598 RepID=UPI001E5715F5|nr:PT domain-containing protein [Limosilactobacillus reuteri]MCC4383494.1 PT domain-containing protein [Limosilactobacillus reuteri]MCC4411022.1 PT domain-containing protein [Limosilactobacillus reuteri]MCC4420423.1 PT domain-containing protein [Limosilactobacillus reuteri]
MSKNNAQEYVRKMEPQRQRFGLRKLSVGVASVLLGTTFMVGGTVVHADSTPTSTVASSTSDQSQGADQRVANEVNEKATASESVSTNAVSQNDSQSRSALGSQTSGSQVEANTGRNSNTNQAVAKSSEAQTSNSTTATPRSAKALTESKAQNQDTVTANVNLIDDDTNFGTGDTITTKIYTLNSGATVTDLINQIKKDLDTVTEDYYGSDPELDSTAGGVPTAEPTATGTYKHAPIATLDDKTRRFNLDPSTLKDKPTLAGYTITTDNNDNLDAAITNNATYNINLIHRMSVLQDKYFYKSYTRQITYKMYGLDDQSIAPTTVTQYAVAQVQNGKNYNKVNSTTNHNEVNIADVVYSWDMATGAQNNLTTFTINWRGLVLVFDGQKSPVATDGSEYSQLAGWIPDKDVDPTPNTQAKGYSLWLNAPGLFYKNKHVDAVQDETVTYYHNQPVDLSFEDISTVAPQDLSGNNYEASNELTYNNTASNQYDVYGALNKDSKNLSDVIKSIEDKGYKLVSITNDDDASQTDLKDNSQINLTYDKDGVWKNDQLVHKAYTIKFVHDVKPTTENTSVSRNIHYVADEGNSQYEVLKDPDTQTVNFERTAYIDQVTKQEVIKNADGTYSELPSNFMPTWKAVGTDNFDKIQKDRFNKDEGKVPGVWEIERANYDDPEGTQLTDNFAPEVANVDAAKTYKDIYLVYREKAQYNIHYIDVNGVEGKTTYEPTDGHELTDHLVPNVGEGKGIFVGDTPDATQKLWSPADYEKAGYVLVGLSDNAKGDLLGKQTLTHGIQDQYVYLKHAVKTITPNTPVEDVPKDPNGNPIVDPSDLHKEFHRTIFYKANATDGQTLMGQTDQKTEFNGTIAYDVVTGKTTTPETVKDVNGKDVQVATLKDGAITWDKQNDKFSAVNQPTIELKKGDKYATSDDMIGTWELVDGEAGEVDLTPASKNPDDKTLVYKQKAQYNIHYIDVNGVEDKTTYEPTDGHELTDHLVPNVGEGKGIFIGDTPDATAKLWSPADYEKAGYVLVGLSDNAKGDLLGKQTLTHGVQDQYVYLKHAVKDITPNTPVDDVPKDPDGKRAIDPSDLHKEFTRNITFVANNDAKSPLKDSIPQKVEFDGHIYVDMVTGQTTTPETVKDANGKNIQVATTKAGNIEWNHDTQTMDEVVRKYITLNKGDKYATSDDMVGTWHWISGTADEITLKPTSTNPEDLVLVYEKNKSESGPDEDHDLPKVDVKQETKTFTRNVVYRGTKDGGVHFESVNGSPDGKNTYKQSVTFTRSIFSTTDKDGKVTILKTAPWTAKDDTLGEVVSKTPSEVGYELVDIEKVDAYKINPNTDPEDLGETIVTYSMKPKHETGPDEDHDLPKVDVKQETKTFTRTVVYRGTKDGGVHFESVDGSPDGKNTYKQTVTFTRSIFSTTDKDGKVTILKTTPWTAKDDTLGEVVSKTPSEVGYEVVDIDKVDAYKIDPNADPENLGETIVTYRMKPKHETGPDEDHDLPKVDVKQETKTFTRTVVYRGTKDGGVHFESVNGSPDGKNTYKQTATFTRSVSSTTDKDGKVTILETTPWTAKDDTLGEVVSKTPSAVGYEVVDIDKVDSYKINPDKDNPDLGIVTVTYEATPTQPTEQPTSQPTAQPTEQPTSQPTAQPTEQPTSQPTAQPTEQPTSQPTAQPTEQPTSQPTAQPTEQPTSQPTVQPTEQPTSQPTAQPTEQLTSQPTAQPTEQPAIESNTQLPGEQKNEEPQPMTTQVTTKNGETSIVEPTNSSSTQPTTKQDTQQLPQTGNQKSSSLIGLGFAGLLSALGLTKVNKKRKD